MFAALPLGMSTGIQREIRELRLSAQPTPVPPPSGSLLVDAFHGLAYELRDMLRWMTDPTHPERVRDAIIDAFAEQSFRVQDDGRGPFKVELHRPGQQGTTPWVPPR